MDLEKFKHSTQHTTPPEELSPVLKALWFDRKGDWEEAHELVDNKSGNTAAWVHAYLHRKEGDIWNADYWYRQANRTRPNYGLEREWEQIVKELL